MDEDGVFEQIVSPSQRVRVPEGFVLPPALADLLVPIASFNALNACPTLNGLGLSVENVSRVGRPRIDFSIAGAQLSDFVGTDTAFGGDFDAEAEIAVGNIFLTFVNDLSGEVSAALSPEIIARADPLTGELIDNETVDIIWSVRGEEVASLVTGPSATATASVDIGGSVCNFATIDLLGNSGIADGTATGVAQINGTLPVDPELEGAPIGQFLGNNASIDGDTVAFENVSRDGEPRFGVTIPNVPIGLFNGLGFSDPILAGDEIAVNAFELTFVDGGGNLTGTFGAEAAAISVEDALGVVTVDQEFVNVLFSIRGDAAVPLVNGTTTATVSIHNIGIAEFNLFGDSSLNSAQDVVVLTTNEQLLAAQALDEAVAGGDAVAIETATAAFEDANMAAASAVTEAQLAAELALEPSVLFTGTAADIDVDAITFENAGRDGQARFEIRVPRVRLNRFPGHGFGDPVVAEDEIAVEGISLTFTRGLGGPVTGIFAPELVARVNENTLAVNQNRGDVLFAIRGPDVAPLVSGIGELIISVGAEPVAKISVFGESADNDAQDVVVLSDPAEFSAAFALDVATVMGEFVGIALAQGDLARAMALTPNVIGDPVAVSLSVTPTTDDVTLAPTTQPILENPVPTSEIPEYPATGIVDDRGRLRIIGSCDPGGLAWAPPLNCRSHDDGTFDCRGRALMPGTEVNVTCHGGEPAILNLLVAAEGKADKRGQLRISGACETGEAYAPKLTCSNRRGGNFRCTSNGNLNPEETARVYCRCGTGSCS